MHAPAGELPLPVVRLLASMRCVGKVVSMKRAGPGFTLPANIGDLDPAVTKLSLRECNLIGALFYANISQLCILPQVCCDGVFMKVAVSSLWDHD